MRTIVGGDGNFVGREEGCFSRGRALGLGREVQVQLYFGKLRVLMGR